jgi:hypothetical protein
VTGFFAAIAARAVGVPSLLQPRRAQRFEHLDAAPPGADAGLTVVEDRTVSAPPAPTGLREPPPNRFEPGRSPVARPTGRDAGAPEPPQRPPQTPVAQAAPVPDVETATTSTDDLDRVVQAARQAVERAARLASERPEPARVEKAAPRPRQRPMPEPVSPAPALPLTAALSSDTQVEAGTTPVRDSTAREDASATPVAHEGPDRGPDPRIKTAMPVARPEHPPGRGAQPVDLAALLREQVFNALTDRGSVRSGVTPVVATSSTPRTPRVGTATVRADGVRIDQPAVEAATSGDVHVHIARVTVTQPPSPPAPRVSRSETVRRSVDHQAYLARRRERG